MDKEQATQYISDLINKRVEVTSQEEIELLKHLLSAHDTVSKIFEETVAAQKNVTRLENLLSRCEGKREAFADLLISAECSRRTPVAPVSHEPEEILRGLRSALQNDTVEVVRVPARVI